MPRTPSFPRRGSVYRVQFDPAVGHEIRKTRPALVVSNDHMNELAATVLVMPITSGRYPYFHWIALKPPEGGLAKPSSIVTEQIRAIDKRRLSHRLGTIRPETMAKVEQAIRDHFGLPESDVLPNGAAGE
jgi:mRNA interferase MazF